MLLLARQRAARLLTEAASLPVGQVARVLAAERGGAPAAALIAAGFKGVEVADLRNRAAPGARPHAPRALISLCICGRQQCRCCQQAGPKKFPHGRSSGRQRSGSDGTSPESRRCFNTLENFSAASVFVLVLFSGTD